MGRIIPFHVPLPSRMLTVLSTVLVTARSSLPSTSFWPQPTPELDFCLLPFQAPRCTSSLAPGVSCMLGVFFDPTASGNITGTLTITDNAPGGPHTVSLAGTGQDFALAPASGSTTSAAVTVGQTASYNLSITPGGGLTGNLAVTCSGAPAGSTCTVSSSSTTLNGSSPVTVVVNVTTTAPLMTSPRGPLSPPPLGRYKGLLLLGLLAVVMTLVVLPRSRLGADLRRSLPFPMLRLAAMPPMALVWAGCSGGSTVVHNPGTPGGNLISSR